MNLLIPVGLLVALVFSIKFVTLSDSDYLSNNEFVILSLVLAGNAIFLVGVTSNTWSTVSRIVVLIVGTVCLTCLMIAALELIGLSIHVLRNLV
jgi:hypothetical protein